MTREDTSTERLVADIPVELKRKITAAAVLRPGGIKGLVIEMANSWFSSLNADEIALIDQILARQDRSGKPI